MKPILTFFMLFMSLFKVNSLIAQIEIPLVNPSFEGIPRAGSGSFPLKNWKDCRQFPSHTPPDIHGSDTRFWRVSTQPYDGKTFLGLVTRLDGSHECVSQNLVEPLEKEKSYRLQLFICQDRNYWSMLPPGGELINFNQPTVVRIWGGNQGDDDKLLAVSDPIDHSEWREYGLDLFPAMTITYLSIEAYFANDLVPGAGHVLIDHARLVKLNE